jgi:pyrroline-5-carboxylate reductase
MSQLNNRSIAVIGAGNMGGALIRGLVTSVRPGQVTAVDIDSDLLTRLKDELGIETSEDALGAVKAADLVVIAIKPQHLSHVSGLREAMTGNHLVVSIAAGVSTQTLEDVFGEVPVVRSMPNILAQVGESVAALCAGKLATDAHVEMAAAVLGAVGETVVVEEKQMDAVTGLSGSGPAYVFALIDALADGGVKCGLPKATATKLATQTVLGSAKMVAESGEHPMSLKDKVTSPGGTTIAGLKALEDGGFRAALMNAVEAATRRSEELGNG